MKKIAIHSVPRSGSTWLGCILDSSPEVLYKYQPLFSYAFKDYLTPFSTSKEINSFFSSIRDSLDDFINQNQSKEKGIVPSFSKSETADFVVYKEVRYHNVIENLLQQDEEIKVIGLVRSPLEVLTSWIKAPKEFRKDLEWSVDKEWRWAESKNMGRPEEFYGYEKWKDVANLFLRLEKEYPDNFILIKYDDLNGSTENTIENLFDFCQLPMSTSTLDFINKSQSITKGDTYSVFRTKKKKQKTFDLLGEAIVHQVIQELEGTPLSNFL